MSIISQLLVEFCMMFRFNIEYNRIRVVTIFRICYSIIKKNDINMYVKNFLSFNMFFVTEIAKLKKNNIEIKLKIGKIKLTYLKVHIKSFSSHLLIHLLLHSYVPFSYSRLIPILLFGCEL